MDAFGTIPAAFGAAAADVQSDVFWNLITTNPNLSDGNAFFNVGDGNLAGAADDIDVDAIGIAVQYFRNIKNLAGRPMNLMGTHIVVGPSKEKQARQYLSGNYFPQAQSGSGAQIPEWKAFTLEVEPRIADDAWYVFAVTPRATWAEYAFLDGEESPFVETRIGWDVDGVEIKARLDFGAGLIDRRPAFKFPA